ncbi:MAG: DEAD/DEAH box helicase [Candidatus Micrarchaeota archaeon]|nr:DEAD/DEAH box helicase [Candidatus Micrarchaeota archaeon]
MPDVYSLFLGRNKDYTEIQKIAMPIIRDGRNCLVVAPTGYGKTEAAMLPLIDLASRSGDGIKVLYITPLRALNRDAVKRLEWLCSHAGVGIGVRHGDTPQSERRRQVLKAPGVLITTPETLQSILVNEKLRSSLVGLKAVVVDEIHELHHSKRGAQLSVALERLVNLAGEYQRVGISATVGDRKKLSRFLVGKRECEIAEAGSKRLDLTVEMAGKPSASMNQVMERFGLDDDAAARLELTGMRIKQSNSTLIFANTRQVVEAVGSRLVYINKVEGFGGIGVHHSSLDRLQRIELEDEFKNGKVRSIIATSSLELGIDIGSVDLVVQYGSPRQSLRLAQRVGRSGHKVSGVPKGTIIPLNVIDAIEAAVLCKRASEGDFESSPAQMGALDVLANQISGMALESGRVEQDTLYKTVARSFVYEGLREEELEKLLEFMARQHMIGFGGGVITPGRGTRMYYIGHLSVITDVKKFVVKNVIENRVISTLDERFVANNVDEGSVFITKGLPWKVISIDENVVSVEPSMEVEAAVPDWEGEDIPVSYKTAQEFVAAISGGADSIGRYCTDEARAKINGFIESQIEHYTPSNGEVMIESFGTYKVIYTWLGTAANDALSKMVAKEVENSYGVGIATRTTPYAIVAEVGNGSVDVAKCLMKLSRGRLRQELEAVIGESEIFRYRFIAVAKLFGLVDRDALVSRSLARRLIKVMNGTPLTEEVRRELMNNHFDLDNLSHFLTSIAEGKIKVKGIHLDRASPLTKELVNYSHSAKELVLPLTPNNELVGSFSRFILSKSSKFICTYCGFVFSKRISELKDSDELRCESCGSPMISVYDDSYRDAISKRLAGKRLSRSEQGAINEAVRTAGLISSYGRRGAMALSVYGIGPKTAARALMMQKHEERDFFIDLIEAQKTFIRTKKYWSV